MTTYTETQLARRVLRDLGLLGVDEVGSAEEIAEAIESCSSEIQQMQTRQISIWGGTDVTIPVEYLTALSRRISLAVGPGYGLFSIVDATAAIIPAEKLLRQLSSQEGTGAVQTAEYF